MIALNQILQNNLASALIQSTMNSRIVFTVMACWPAAFAIRYRTSQFRVDVNLQHHRFKLLLNQMLLALLDPALKLSGIFLR